MTSRRQFIKGVSATAAMSAFYSRDLMADLIATSPSGRVLESKFKGLADIALGEAKLAGATYSDIRFTMTATPYGGTATFNADGGGRGRGAGAAGAAGGRGGGGGGGGGGGRGGRGGAGQIREVPTEATRQPGGFGVRVIHSGVWGFASSPIVTEDEIKRISRLAVEVAKASAIAKKANLQ